jgi:hypothetical protein
MHAVHMLRHTWTCERIAGSHSLYSGMFCGVTGYNQIKWIREAATTSARGAKQATVVNLSRLRNRKQTIRLNESVVIATSVHISTTQYDIQNTR